MQPSYQALQDSFCKDHKCLHICCASSCTVCDQSYSQASGRNHAWTEYETDSLWKLEHRLFIELYCSTLYYLWLKLEWVLNSCIHLPFKLVLVLALHLQLHCGVWKSYSSVECPERRFTLCKMSGGGGYFKLWRWIVLDNLNLFYWTCIVRM